MIRTITHVALKYKGRVHAMPRPCRHHHIFNEMYEKYGIEHVSNEEQGFLDDKGQFINRREGLILARINGQLKPRQPGQYDGDELYSEDIW